LNITPGWGDRAFDYLLGVATEIPAAAVHPGLWRLLPAHLTRGTIEPVAQAAHRAGHRTLALTLIRRLPRQEQAPFYAEVGSVDALTPLARENYDAAIWLAELLVERGDVEALTARADAGDKSAADWCAGLLAEPGDVEALTALADAGDKSAADWCAGLLAERGDVEALTALADAGDKSVGRVSSELNGPR
jgi:hypothetical protein